MRHLRLIYGSVVFLSAFLLFLVEPMAAKQLLPVLGGSSAVWVTCLVFFQAALLLGYIYAWQMARRSSLWLHLALLAGAVALLLVLLLAGIALGSFAMEVHWSSSASQHPVLTIFLALGATIGLPFVMLGSTSPLLQLWWANTEQGVVPYRLFALSNAGSLLALVIYPLLVESELTLAAQRTFWAAGFVLYAGLSGWLGIRAHRLARDAASVLHGVNKGTTRSPSTQEQAEEISPARRWIWFLLPMAAAMQLSAVTSHLSQDIAPIPLLWILPLGTYLLTFIVAFELPGLYRRWMVGRFLAVLLASLGYALSKMDTRLPVGLAVLFYLLEIFVACWFCHAEVYRLRPATPRKSTVFYLLLAAGGVAGTFLVGIASPLLFRANYDLAIAFFVTALMAAVVTWQDGWGQRLLWSTGSALLLGLAVAMHVQFERHALMTARNFYGALRVMAEEFDDQGDTQTGNKNRSAFTGTGAVRVLMNGRIRHGMQMMESEERRRTPTTYYGEDSGVGVALRSCCAGRAKNVGVIGLGAGTLAAFGRQGDRMKFYEINPLVEPVARNLFTYLRDSRASVSVVEGDGRAMLTREPPQSFDVLVVDAFSGDAIPLHLLTREAMMVYQRQLVPGGVIAFHVSNSYLDLPPEIALLADADGMQARVVENEAVPADGAYRSTWVLVSKDAAFFDRPGVRGVAMEISRRPGLRVWTDDYSSLFPVLRLTQ